MRRSLILLSILAVGCGSSTPTPSAPEKVSLAGLVRLYGQYRSSHQGQVPKNEEEFKAYLKGLPETQMNASGVQLNELDKLFVSARDKQPYVVRYGSPPVPGSDGETAVAYEKTGVNGMRLVGYTTGRLSEIDEVAYQALKFPGG